MKQSFSLKQEAPYLGFLAPALIAYTLFGIVPLAMSFRYAFTNWDGLNRADFVGFQNFLTAFKDPSMRTAVFNTLLYGFSVPFLVTVCAIPLALVMNTPMRTRNFQRAVFFFPSVPSALILGYVWGYMLNPTKKGAINILLGYLGVDPVLWLAKPHLAMLCLIFVAVWSTAGWHACIYLANLQSIPKEYYEASTIDGANSWSKFRFITFPMLAPSMTISVMLLITGSLKVFDLPFALTDGGPGYSTTMVTQIIINRGVTEKMYGKATAMSVLFFIVIFIITAVQLTLMKKREEDLS